MMPPATASATTAPATATATGIHPTRDPPRSARDPLRLTAQLPAQLTSAHPWRRERDVGASPVGTGKVKSLRVWPPQQTIARCFSLGAANGQTGRRPRAGADPVPVVARRPGTALASHGWSQ